MLASEAGLAEFKIGLGVAASAEFVPAKCGPACCSELASFSHLLTWIERAGAFGIREPKGFLTDRCLEIDWLTKT